MDCRKAMPTRCWRKGDLKFRLDGQKLKGDFALVHIRSRKPGSKGNEWLLIKHRDAYVQEGYDIDEHDGSVLTGRTWTRSRATRAQGSGRATKSPAAVPQRRMTGWPIPSPRPTRSKRKSAASRERRRPT